MKRKTIIISVSVLAILGIVSYAIIWYRKKSSSTATNSGSGSSTTTTTTAAGGSPGASAGSGASVAVKTGSATLPAMNSYAWWLSKLGRAKFPLGYGSRGLEVYKVQEVLNKMVIAQKLNVGAIVTDGIWGPKTDARFKLLFPLYNQVSLYMYVNDFDPTRETLE